jgi:hypothetical protein
LNGQLLANTHGVRAGEQTRIAWSGEEFTRAAGAAATTRDSQDILSRTLERGGNNTWFATTEAIAADDSELTIQASEELIAVRSIIKVNNAPGGGLSLDIIEDPAALAPSMTAVEFLLKAYQDATPLQDFSPTT